MSGDLPETELVHRDDSPLEAGWSSSAPVGDSIVLDASRAMAAAYTVLAGAGGHRHAVVDEMRLEMGDAGAATPFANTAHLGAPLAALGSDAPTRLVAELHHFFDAADGGPFLLFSTWPTGDLAPFGLALVGHPPLMAAWGTVAPPPRPDLVIRRAVDAATLGDFERTLIEGYPIPEMCPYRPTSFLAPGMLDTPWRFHVGYVDGEPVACAAGYDGQGVTLVEMVATRAEVRGRGFGALLTAAAMGDAGERPAVLIASDDGQGVYASLGFRRIMRFTLWAGARRR